MAKTDFEIPELQEYPEIPPVVAGTMAHSQPYIAKAEFQAPLGYPGELVDDWHDKAIQRLGELVGERRQGHRRHGRLAGQVSLPTGLSGFLR